MDTRIRIKTILLLGKIKADPVHATRIAVKDGSHYRKYRRSEG